MTATVAQIWRHPIKAHGREALRDVTLTAGQGLPWDRHWAVAHEAAKVEDGTWARCMNFTRAAGSPSLMAIESRFDPDTRRVTLTHADRDPIEFAPDDSPAEFFDWVRPMIPEGRAQPVRIVSADRAMTDSQQPTISLMSLASHRAVEDRARAPLSKERWRGNLWLDGLTAWEECDWVGRRLTLGTAELEVIDRITRCMATAANPDTGQRDIEMLDLLDDAWGHQTFGVNAVVIQGGELRLGDALTLL